MQIESDPKKRGAGKTVLVVDDNPATRKVLASVFLSDGFKTCAEAGDGRKVQNNDVGFDLFGHLHRFLYMQFNLKTMDVDDYQRVNR